MSPSPPLDKTSVLDEGVTALHVVREHIVSTPDTCGGKPCIAGSRIQVKDIAMMHERMQMTPEQIVAEYPHLSLADIYAALTYYHDHREAINAEIKADRQSYDQMRASNPSRLEQKLSRWEVDASDNPLPSR